MNLLTLDLESYYDQHYNLEKLTTEEYVRSPLFEVQCVGLKSNRHPTVVVHGAAFRDLVAKIDWDNTGVIAHHAHFEGLVLWHHYGVRPRMWFDTLSMARYLYSGEVGLNLEDLTRYLGVTPKGKIPAGVKGMRLGAMPQPVYDALAEYCKGDVDGEFEAFEIMYPQIPERELGLIDLTVRMFSEPVLEANVPFLEEYAAWEDARRQEMLDRLGKTATDFRSTEKFAQILRDHGVPDEQLPRHTSPSTGHVVLTFAKDHAWMQAQLLQPADDPIRQLCEARVTFASSLRRTRTRRIIEAAKRGPLPVYLNYHKAGPGRWSGGDKMNYQNLDRIVRKPVPGKFDEKGRPVVEPVYGTGMMRRGLRAPEGYELVVVDSSQIEARDTAYQAGQTNIVEAFARGEDVYSSFASRIYGRKVDRKANPEDELPGFVGKVSILGLGYSMWWPRFASELLWGMMGADPVLLGEDTLQALDANIGRFVNNPKNLEKVRAIVSRHPFDKLLIHCICSWEIVNRYREANDKIAGLWETCELALGYMARGVEFCFGAHGSIHTERNALVLPSGRRILYPDLEYTRNGWRYRDPEERKWTHIYGGKTLENTIQGDCRDLVAYPMLDLSRSVKVAMMSHDEVVAVVPLGAGARVLPLMMERMRQAPDTHPGLPLNASGGVGIYYGDAK